MDLIKVKNVTLSYENNIIIKNLSLTIKEGDYLCIVGDNGSGKSTFIKALLGLKKPSKGEIILNNLLHKEIGYLPQQTTAQKDFPASVYEIVLSGCLNSIGIKPFYSKKDKEKVLINLEKLNILDLKDKCYRELSGGQQQRVLLARSLCSTKKILLLDEPIAGLDPKSSRDLYKLTEELNLNEKITIVMVSHDIDTALSYANKILQIHPEHTFFGTVEDYVNKGQCDCFGGEAHD